LGGLFAEDLEAAEVIYTEVALRLHVPKEKVLKCIKATVKVFVWALSKGKNFDFVFKNVGILLCREGRVTMRFFENLLREVDKTGKLANAFLQV
ncbi:Coiled-coil domain-containing protein 81, partial [Nipponia nippon]